MPTRGLAAVLNQGLATLGEKLGNFLLIITYLHMILFRMVFISVSIFREFLETLDDEKTL